MTYRYNMHNRRLVVATTVIFTLIVISRISHALTLSEFRTCISSQGSAGECVLNAGTYYIGTNAPDGPKLLIARSNITVRGGGASRTDTTLIRNTAEYQPLMEVGSGVTGVEIRNLSFDGNRGNFPLSYKCLCDKPTYDLDKQNGGNSCTAFTDQQFGPPAELKASPGTNITVSSTEFRNAPWFALEAASNSLIINSNFYSSRVGGIYGKPGVNYVNNSIEENGVNAVFVFNNSLLRANSLIHNHMELIWGHWGGQIFMNGESNITVGTNIFDGDLAWGRIGQPVPNGMRSQFGCTVPRTGPPVGTFLVTGGIEAWNGSNLYFWNNSIFDHRGPGIGVSNLFGSIEVTGYDPGSVTHFRNAISGNGSVDGSGTDDGFRIEDSSAQILFNMIMSINNSGYGLRDYGNSSESFTNGACLTGNGLGRASGISNVPPTDTCN